MELPPILPMTPPTSAASNRSNGEASQQYESKGNSEELVGDTVDIRQDDTNPTKRVDASTRTDDIFSIHKNSPAPNIETTTIGVNDAGVTFNKDSGQSDRFVKLDDSSEAQELRAVVIEQNINPATRAFLDVANIRSDFRLIDVYV